MAMSETERLDEQLIERLTEIVKTQADNSQTLIAITQKLAVATQAQSLAYIELALALHDAGVVSKETLAERLRKAAGRSEQHAHPKALELLTVYAEGLDSAKQTQS
jgi:hypothetical protein